MKTKILNSIFITALVLSLLALLPIPRAKAATVVELAPTNTPGHVLVKLDVAGTPLLARITRRSAEKLAIRPGLALHAQIKAVALLA